jgi:uncharacterized membrane protein
MIFPPEIIIRGSIFILSVFGFFVAKHIYNHKTNNTPLVCMVGFDCHSVVHSDYSKFLGIRVEILGMIYYAFSACMYLLFILMPYTASYTYISLYNLPFVSSFGLYLSIPLLFCVSLAAFLFSVYLIAIQTFVIKKACSWCIISALVCFAIFLLVLFG